MKRNNYENTHQKALVKWARLQPEIGMRLIHIPNEGKRDAIYGKHLKEMGMVPGCFDLFLAIPKLEYLKCVDRVFPIMQYAGFFIELKSLKGTLSKAQKEFSYFMHRDMNYKLAMTNHWVSAAKAICDYLGMEYRGL